MTKRPVTNLPASVHDRLGNLAKEQGRPFNEVLQRYVRERFLYRLGVSPFSHRFVLEGAALLSAWQTPLSRPTRDIDLLGQNMNDDPRNLEDVVRQVCLAEVEPDGLHFLPDSVSAEPIMEEANYGGVRVKLRFVLGSPGNYFHIDIGFGDPVYPAPEMVDYPTMLGFPAPKLRGYTRDSVVAEKLETMVRRASVNSRLKDFYDVWFLSRRFSFEGRVWRQPSRPHSTLAEARSPSSRSLSRGSSQPMARIRPAGRRFSARTDPTVLRRTSLPWSQSSLVSSALP